MDNMYSPRDRPSRPLPVGTLFINTLCWLTLFSWLCGAIFVPWLALEAGWTLCTVFVAKLGYEPHSCHSY